jgi:hypothetical protein
VTADGARHCVFEGCEVAHIGTYGVWFRRGCKDCRIQRNRLFDLGAGGVRVGEATMARTEVAETSRTLVDNNHIFDGGRSLNERLAAKESPGQWDENIDWHAGGPDQLRFYRHTFAEWQELGLDRRSRVADPQFADAANHDFRLEPGSPAFALGIQPIKISQVGLYGDPAWAGESRHANCPHTPLPPPPAQAPDNFAPASWSGTPVPLLRRRFCEPRLVGRAAAGSRHAREWERTSTHPGGAHPGPIPVACLA